MPDTLPGRPARRIGVATQLRLVRYLA